MIKCIDIQQDKIADTTPPFDMTVGLIADNIQEVVAMGNTANNVVGIPNGTKLSFGSTCMTVHKDFGILGTNGWDFS